MAYNAAYSESWGHYRDGGGSYYEDIQSSLASKNQSYAEPSRTKKEDYKYAPFNPDNVAHHQRELEQWSHGKSTAAQGSYWSREPGRGSPAAHPSQAPDTYNPYGSRTMAHPVKQEAKYDAPVRRQRSRSMSPAAKRHRYEDDGYYGRPKEEYHGGNTSYNGGYDRQRSAGPTSLRDPHQTTQYSQPAYTSPSNAYPTDQYASQVSSQSSYGYNTGHYYTANYRPSYLTSPVRPPRINRPEIQPNIRQGPNSHHIRAPRPVFGGRSTQPVKRPPVPSPPKKAGISSVPKVPATGKAPVKPGNANVNGKATQQDEEAAERKRAKKRTKRQEKREKFATAAQEATKTGQTAKSNSKPVAGDDKKKPFPDTPDVIILGNSKPKKKAEPSKPGSSGPAQDKHGFFSRVLAEITKPERQPSQKTDAENGTTKADSSAVKSVQNGAAKPAEVSAPAKPTIVQSQTPAANQPKQPATIPKPPPIEPRSVSPVKPRSVSPVKPKGPEEFTVTHNQIIIKRPRGQWSMWSNSQKIAAIRWLNAYPEGKVAQRLRDLGIPEDENLWPYFEEGVWIVPVVQVVRGTGAVVGTVMEPPVKDAVEEKMKVTLDISQRSAERNVEKSVERPSTNVHDQKVVPQENIRTAEQHAEPKSAEMGIPSQSGDHQKATVTEYRVEEKRDEQEAGHHFEQKENDEEQRDSAQTDGDVEMVGPDKGNDSSTLESSSMETKVSVDGNSRDGSPEFEVPAGKGVTKAEDTPTRTDAQDGEKADAQEELDGEDVVLDSADGEEDVVLDSA